ncbi:hypothetical protein WICPIJ_009773 [Wickerhamomyces pijperi]|uniref:Uncharacterized protein n=1 Tax=Wickerhamomyces pijperi TaxID=599730 RepID=A0A9P8PKE3_WICPI|nr:hypothetical protein WICPIJ_009773 [Wickerhamomyces pijperi]
MRNGEIKREREKELSECKLCRCYCVGGHIKSLKCKRYQGGRCLFSLLRCVNSVIVLTFDDILDSFHLFDLLLPGHFVELLALVEQLGFWLSVRVTQSVPQGGELTVVVVEVQVVDGVASSTVDDRVVGHVLTVVDHHGPEVDEGEKKQVRHLVQWEDKRVDVVWQGLHVAVNRVEGVGGERSRDQPLVVWLVERLVDTWPVQPSVDQVDAEVSEHDEGWELQ